MVSWTNRAAQIWRDYITDGVPASGAYPPDKSQIRTWGLQVENGIDGSQPLDAQLTDIAGLSFVQGDLIYFNGSNLVRLPAGTAGQLLQTNGAAANPAWVAGPSAVPGVRQTVLLGPDTSGVPAFLPSSSASLSLTSQSVSASSPLVVTAAGGFGVAGPLDRIGASTSNITWSGLTASTTCYLYVDIAANGALTPGFTTLAPIYQNAGSPSTVNGQFTFNIFNSTAYVGNGSAANPTYRVYVGEAVTSGSGVTSTVAYGFRGRSQTAQAALPAASSATTLNHNLGTNLVRTRMELVCTVADNGYSIGDILPFASTGYNPGTYIAIAHPLSITGRNTARLNNITGMYAPAAGGATMVLLTAASWQYRAYFERGWAGS